MIFGTVISLPRGWILVTWLARLVSPLTHYLAHSLIKALSLYLNMYRMERHTIWCRYSCFPEDESKWLWWYSSSAIMGSTFVGMSDMFQQILDGLPWQLEHTFIPRSEWIVTLWCHQQVTFSNCPKLWFTTKYLQNFWHSYMPQWYFVFSTN